MSLSDISIKKPVFTWILMFGLIFFGVLSFQKMGINESPDVDYPTVSIRYEYVGAAPGVVEKDVIEPVEAALVAMEGIRNMSSTAQRGSANISLEFSLSRDIDFALQEVQTILSKTQANLPTAVLPPVVAKNNAADEPILYMALKTTDLPMRQMMILFRDYIRDRFAIIDGVAEVQAYGYHEPVLRIDLKRDQMNRYQLTSQDIIESIQRSHLELPAGKFELEDKEDLIRIMGEAEKVEDFANIPISRRGGQPNFRVLRLKDVATIYEDIENLRRISRVNGVSALAIAVQKQRGVNSVAVADAVKVRMAEVAKELPPGAELSITYDRSQFIRETVNELTFTLVLSAILTSIVCWMFLGSLSATFNILLAIPTAVIGTFIFIHLLGFTLNSFSLLGLTLAIGVVVDDAIIMLENIVRYMQNGYSRVDAAFKGAREITFAVIATTAALVAIFLPIAFLEGIEGRFFFEFAVTICIAVCLSSLEALTLAPMRCSQFLRIEERTTKFGLWFEKTMASLANIYHGQLQWVLRHRISVIAVSIIMFGIAMLSLTKIGTEFEPAQDRGALFVMFIAPDGKSMKYTNEKVLEFEKIVRAHPDVQVLLTAVGGFGTGGQGNRGNGLVVLKDKKDRSKSQFEIAAELNAQLSGIQGLRIVLRDRFGSQIGGRRGSPVEFTINGPDPATQADLFEKLKTEIESTGLVSGFRSDDVSQLPEIQYIPNRDQALKQGVEVAEIARVINSNFGGVTVGQYTVGTRRYDMLLQLQEQDRTKADDINGVFVRNNRGEAIELKEVVSGVLSAGPQTIFREDRIRGIRVDSNIEPQTTIGEVINIIQAKADALFPTDYFIRFSAKPQEKIFAIVWIMVLGIIVSYMVLSSQFNSFIDPVIVFISIPFGVVGSFLGLYMFGQTLNVYSLIGILLTIGIVMKNAILLVEFSNLQRTLEPGLPKIEALLRACPTRLRPILMTTLSTVAAAIPPALALGPGSETSIPMAIALLTGVSVSTFFTLYIVPIVYSWIAQKNIGELVESTASNTVPHDRFG